MVEQEYRSRLVRYQNDPLSYLINHLNFKREHIVWSDYPEYENHKWDGDKDPLLKIINAVSTGKWCGVQSATGTSKTYLAAGIAYWFLECFRNSKVITVAPKQDQLELNIWSEIHKLYKIYSLGELQTLNLSMAKDSSEWILTAFVAGTRANEEITTKAQGFHAEHMLIIFEEMPGIDPALVSAFENTCAGSHNIILALGNPDHQLDTLAQFCMREDVTRVRISGYDYPNVVCKKELIPGAQSEVGLKRLSTKYGGEGSPFFDSRARGICPQQSNYALINYEWCFDAIKRGQEIDWSDSKKFEGKRKAMGVDSARSEAGDKAAKALFIGEHCKYVVSKPCPDPNALGFEVARDIKTEGIESKFVGVDVVGVGGETAGVLRGLGFEVFGIVGGDPMVEILGSDTVFENLRCQMWWQAREDLRLGKITMPDDKELVTDLTTPMWEAKAGKIWVEGKKEYKKRLGRSPDKGDAFVYANWMRNGIGIPNFDIIKPVNIRNAQKIVKGYL